MSATLIPFTPIQGARFCGSCSKFVECWTLASQIMTSSGMPVRDDFERCKTIPACPDFIEGGNA